jgi:DNA invertase Pin-like site-specific DNA recombinase
MSETYLYVRVSSKQQVVNGQSIPQQVKRLLEHCQRNNLQLAKTSFQSGSPGVFVDPGVSAWHKSPLLERPAFREIWNHIKPGDRVICVSLDRAFRSVRDFVQTWPKLQSKGIHFTFLHQDIDTSTAWGICKAHVMAAFAQLKSDLISQRTMEGLAAKKAGLDMGRRSKEMLIQEVNPLLRIDEPVATERQQQQRGRVFSYARCSSWDQSVSSQIPRLREMVDVAGKDGYTFGGAFADEGISAFSVDWQDRPQGSKLWSQLQPGDIICISRIDRAFRSIVDLSQCYLTLKEMGVGLRIESDNHTTQIDEHDQSMLEMAVLMSQWESRDISWRAKEGVAAAVALRGKRYSRACMPWFLSTVVNRGKWKFVPNLPALAEWEEVLTLLGEGHTHGSASNILEEKIATRDNRIWLPDSAVGVPLNRFVRCQQSRYAPDWAKNLKRYARQDEKRMTNYSQGMVRRPWSSHRIATRISAQEEIDTMYERSPETRSQVLELSGC